MRLIDHIRLARECWRASDSAVDAVCMFAFFEAAVDAMDRERAYLGHDGPIGEWFADWAKSSRDEEEDEP